MPVSPLPPLVDLQKAGWNPQRIAAATAVAAPNNERIALAALTRLGLQDHIDSFAVWCDRQSLERP